MASVGFPFFGFALASLFFAGAAFANPACPSSYLQAVLLDLEAHSTEKMSPRVAIERLLKNNPELQNLGFADFLKSFEKNDRFHATIWRLHIEDWFEALRIKDTTEIEKVRDAWALMTPEHRINAARNLKAIIAKSDLSKVFEDPQKWKADLQLLDKLGVPQSEAIEFNKQWKRLSEAERDLFLFATLSEDLPDFLAYALTKGDRETALVLANLPKMKVKISMGRFSSAKIDIDEALYRAFKSTPQNTPAEWFSAIGEAIDSRSQFRFDDIRFFVDQIPKGAEDWIVTDHEFRSLTVEDAQNLGSFSAVTTLKDGTKIGRMTAVTNYILKMIDKLDSPPTAEAYQTLLKTIRNTRDQAELRFRLHERFPDKF